MADLKGSVAIVTGAAKGIGAEIAKQLAAAGASVVVNYVASKDAAERVVGEIIANGGRGIAVQGDVAKTADVGRLFAATKDTFDRLDILVNNAGIAEFVPIEAVTTDQYRRQFDTNVLGPLLTIREALAHFGPAGGSIINIGSVASVAPTPGSAVYAATKGALSTLTRALALELGGRRVRVNTLAPGPVETEMMRSFGMAESELENSSSHERRSAGSGGRRTWLGSPSS
jgi:3-oxoacyl-[acyl-carrier protein] reductase